MSYVQDNLMPNEKVILSAKISLAVFVPSVIAFIVSVFSIIYAVASGGKQSDTASVMAIMALCIAGFFFFASIIWAVEAFFMLTTTEFAVTNRRIIGKTGFIRRNTLEIYLLKVESVSVHQGILARLLNFGSVTVTGTGGTKQSFKGIIDPQSIRRKINQVVEAVSSRANPPQEAPSNIQL